MKSPAFQFYAGDYLADAQVMMMTLEQEGAYIRLLAICWREGNIPSDLKSLSMLCKGASPAVLRVVTKCFQPNANQPGTLIHKRLNEEIEKQAQWRAKSAAGGKKSAEKRWGDKGGDKGGTNQSVTLLSSTSSSIPSDDGTPPPAEALKANPAKQTAVALTDPEDEQNWDVGPLTKPNAFRVICERLGFLEIDFEHYRRQGLVAAEDGKVSRTISQWNSWIRNYLNHQMKHGPLLKAAQIDLTRPTPRHEFPPEGSDCTGRHIVLPNTGDANLNRVAAQTYSQHYPNAIIHHTR